MTQPVSPPIEDWPGDVREIIEDALDERPAPDSPAVEHAPDERPKPDSTAGAPGHDDHQPAGSRFWVSAALGWAVIAWGVRGILVNSLDTRPSNLARFVVGGALLHDLLLAPVVILVGVLLAKAVPGRARAVVQGALVVSAIVALFSYPLVREYGLATNNPTSLPYNYGANLLIVLGVVWAVAAGLVVARLRRRCP
ncbi:MAG: hypothetical protein ACR2KK_09165 [Acidimicrobiales bacterium]